MGMAINVSQARSIRIYATRSTGLTGQVGSLPMGKVKRKLYF